MVALASGEFLALILVIGWVWLVNQLTVAATNHLVKMK